ncbi:MAG TPA: alpha/beta hydrolase [Acidimicrobiia bacterium]|jgi:3-oxoadipate enol-lactonase|nr:alpha/beta hydrolase [Acidimicrobiia bacterium]
MVDHACFLDTGLGRVSYAETGEGKPTVILHSLLTDRRAFDPVIPSLPGRTITLDLPGYGQTDSAASIEEFADRMAAAVQVLCPEPATVMGNGLGSFVALGMAIRHPELVARMILAGAGATFPEAARPAFGNMANLAEEGGMSAVAPVALARIFTEDFIETHPTEAKERVDVLERTDPKVFAAACRALQNVDFSSSVADLSMPTLIVVGERDQATTPEMAHQLAGLIPNSRLVVLPGIAHAPQLQDPPGFVQTVVGFMEGDT